jgi:hypothetical protein
MAYGGAGMCPDFVLRPKKCKITAKIGKNWKKFKGSKALPLTNFKKFGQKIKKIIMSMSSNILELVINERKKVFKKTLLRGFYHCSAFAKWIFDYWRLTAEYSLRTHGKCSWAGFFVTPYLLGQWCYLYPVHLVKWYTVNCIWKHVFSIEKRHKRLAKWFFFIPVTTFKLFWTWNWKLSTATMIWFEVLKSQLKLVYWEQ